MKISTSSTIIAPPRELCSAAPSLSCTAGRNNDRLRGGDAGVARAEEGRTIEHLLLEFLEVQVDYRSDVEREELRHDEATNHDQPERPTRSCVGPETHCDGDSADDCRECRHDNWPEPVHAGIMDGLFGGFARVTPLAGEVDDHNAVLLDDSHQHEQAHKSIERRLFSEQKQSQQASHQSRRKGRKHRDRVDIALIENSQNHVHHEHRKGHQDCQISDRVLERHGLALQGSSHGRWHDLGRGLGDEIGGISHGHPGLEIEEERNAGELVEVINALGAQGCLPLDQSVERHQVPSIIGLDIQEREVLGLRAFCIRYFQNNLVLVLRFFDEIEVVLRVGVSQESQNPRF